MKRGFIDVDGRLLHYRRIGRGPALVMLHGSPNSSLNLEPLMKVFAGDFDCIAFDTPGNGLSEPLAIEAPSTGDYAEALKAALDAAGLRRVSLYGFHTGAGTAAEFAARYPERVAALVLDGVACWTRDEQKGMLDGYLPAFHPSWDGAHLTWAWARIVEQTIFFPWHVRSMATRMDYDLHPLDVAHETVMEFLAAGDHYRKPYAAALAGDGAARLRKLRSPTLATAHPMDPIAHHLDRVGMVDPAVEIRRETRTDLSEIRAGLLQFLKARPGAGAGEIKCAERRGYLEIGAGQISYRATGGRGRPLLLLHEAGGSSRSFEKYLAALDDVRPVLALDFPGHGDSDAGECANVETLAEIVSGAARARGLDEVDAVGRHLGGAVAVEVKARGRARAAAIIGAACFSDDERRTLRGKRAPDLTPRADGTHLNAAWRYLRHRALFDPWFERRREYAVPGEPALETGTLHAACVDLLKSLPQHQAAFDAELAYPLAARMSEAGDVRVFLEDGDPLASPKRRALLDEALDGGAEFTSLASPGEFVAALEALDR